MITVTIHHNIFLNILERTNLVSGKTIEKTGVCVSVWYNKGKTSEPAQEVFVKYILTNTSEDSPILLTKDGFKINLPKPEKFEKNEVPPPNPYYLLDEKYGGENGILSFKEYHRTKGKERINCCHTVDISTTEQLENSLTRTIS